LPAYLPAANIKAWFPFTGNAIDSTGHGHNGTPFGTTNAKGRFGVPNTAFNFNGTSDYIFVPAGIFTKETSVDITTNLTISAWVKSHNYFFSSQMQIHWRGDATPAHDPHMLYFNSGNAYIRRDIDPGSTVNQIGCPLAGLDTNFHLFTGTYDSASGIMCMYLDGVMRNRAYLPGLQSYPTSTMYNYIGAVDGGTWQFLYGTLDELGIWDRALTPCEIAALYSSVPDIVTTQPINDTTTPGGTAAFSLGVSAPVTATFRWQVKSGGSFIDLSNVSPYSGVTTSTLSISPVTAAMSGSQYRCVVNADSCIGHSTDTATLIVSAVTAATLNVKQKINVTLAPNPNAGSFTIIAASAGESNIAIEVTDMMGRLIHEEVLKPIGGLINQQITLNNSIGDGIYFLRARSETTNEVFRIVVDR